MLAGERYKDHHQRSEAVPAGPLWQGPRRVNEQLRRQAIGSEEVIDVRPADLIKPELNKLRSGSATWPKIREEDVLTTRCSPIGRKFLEEREAGTPEARGTAADFHRQGVAAAGAEGTPTGFVIDVHGETYRVDITGVGVKTRQTSGTSTCPSTACRKKWCSAAQRICRRLRQRPQAYQRAGPRQHHHAGNIVDVLVKGRR